MFEFREEPVFILQKSSFRPKKAQNRKHKVKKDGYFMTISTKNYNFAQTKTTVNSLVSIPRELFFYHDIENRSFIRFTRIFPFPRASHSLLYHQAFTL